MSVINTNITSMIGQQNLSKSQNDLTTSMERLSSGLRINSAKDDAAGQAIANRMSAQRNANDGISVAQTAEGGLNQVNDNLQRVRELAVQAQNGTNSQDDLKSIQAEIGQRLNEQTDFNGTKVLQSDNSLKIQVGANDNEAISIDLQKINATSLGLNNFSVSGDKAATVDDMVNDFGATGTSTYNVDVDGSAASGAGVTVDVVSGTVNTSGGAQLYVSQTTGKLTEEGGTKGIDDVVGNSSAQAADFVSKFKTVESGESAVIGGQTFTRETAGADASGDGVYSATIDGRSVEITIANSDGTNADITVTKGNLYIDGSTTSDNTATGNYVAGTSQFTTFSTNELAREVDLKDNGAAYQGAALAASGNNYTADAGGSIYASGAIAAGDSTGVIADGNAVYIQNAGEANQKLIDQDNAEEASRDPLEKLDSALSMVDTLRSDLGAVQNRFDSAITNLSTNETNLSAARSRIEDADYATEVANMTRAQILQQAGTSVLAQANQIPQSVLSLLG
nr:flagellin [uncultured Halomonas sp.]